MNERKIKRLGEVAGILIGAATIAFILAALIRATVWIWNL